MDKLAPILGTWALSGDQLPTSIGPSAKISGMESFELMPAGNNFVIHNLDGRLDEHPMACLEVWERDGLDGGYELHTFYNNGTKNNWKAVVLGNTWTIRGAWKGPKRTLHVRCTMVFSEDHATRTSRWEQSDDGATWVVFWDVNAKRITT